MITLFFPYYNSGDKARQKEIDYCLFQNAENIFIDKIFVVIDDNSKCPVALEKLDVLHVDDRLTYKNWIEFSEKHCSQGISVLCNSDIYFDDSISELKRTLNSKGGFVALSRWDKKGNKQIKHPNPHWSQDVWAVNVGESYSSSFMHQLDFQLGVPRCDNKIAYLFALQGWQIFNPVEQVKSIHVHETELRSYHKKLDERVIGGVAYVYPGDSVDKESKLDIDVWTKRSQSVNRVSLNKSLEKWISEHKGNITEVAVEHNPISKLMLEEKTSKELLDALRTGRLLKLFSANFSVYQLESGILFNNCYRKEIFGTSIEKYHSDIEAYIVGGLIPPTLDSFSEEIGDKPTFDEDVNFWQYPAATEKQAYDNHKFILPGEHVDVSKRVINIYVPIPWATYIDKKDHPEKYLGRVKAVLSYYRSISNESKFQLKVHSVCQHIRWINILEIASRLGITDLHLSHKDSTSEEKQRKVGTQLDLHGWTLIAVNYETKDRSEGMERKPMAERKLLASFIGAHMKHYRDDSRIRLFETSKASGREDVFVDLGSEWHFNKLVYEEQVLNKEVESHHIDEHHKRTFRYNSVLSDSKFSLCPEGAGPNTLRFWESIALGSVPVLFSKDLGILSSEIGRECIRHCIVQEINDLESLFKKLSEIEISELQSRSSSLIEIYDKKIKNIVTGENL